MERYPANSTDHANAMKLLQDLCLISGRPPSSFVLHDVTFDRRHVVGQGGQVTVWEGRMKNQQVVVREVVRSDSDWKSIKGKKIIQVISGGQVIVNDFSSDFFSCCIARQSFIRGFIIRIFYRFLVLFITPIRLIQRWSYRLLRWVP